LPERLVMHVTRWIAASVLLGLGAGCGDVVLRGHDGGGGVVVENQGDPAYFNEGPYVSGGWYDGVYYDRDAWRHHPEWHNDARGRDWNHPKDWKPQARAEKVDHPAARPEAGHDDHPAAKPEASRDQHPAAKPEAGHDEHPAAKPEAAHDDHPAAQPEAGHDEHKDEK